MEKGDFLSTDYRSLVADKLKNNFRSLVIGTFCLSVMVSSVFFYVMQINFKGLNQYLLNSITTPQLPENTTVQNLSRAIYEKNLTQITPNASGAAGLPENGQISAIATSQVTHTQNRYTVQPGDSISSIAQQVYGDLNAWPRIAQANNLVNPEEIEVGQVLIIPR